MNNDTFNSIASSLAYDTGIDFDAASKVINWLITEGVLDIPVVNETYEENTVATV
jgi:hypothetical protein